jgi:hypothetical protein
LRGKISLDFLPEIKNLHRKVRQGFHQERKAIRELKKRGSKPRFQCIESKMIWLLFQVRVGKRQLLGGGCEIFFREFKGVGSGCRFFQLSLDFALGFLALLFLPGALFLTLGEAGTASTRHRHLQRDIFLADRISGRSVLITHPT